MKQAIRFSVVLSVIFMLAACGGGGGSGGGAAPAPVTSSPTAAQGLWLGSTNTSRTITGVLLDNGTYWMLYSVANGSAIAGFMEGSSTSTSTDFSSADGVDMNLEGLGFNAATVSATYQAQSTMTGSVTYPSLSQIVNFSGTYSTDYGLTPSLATLAGTYTGTAAVVGGSESATVTISATGAISGSGASGCTFTGTAAPHTSGNIYDFSIAFNGGACALGASTVTGVGYFNASTKALYAAALNSGRTAGFIFTGTKP